jgi:uncharacterized membrane protein YidH (DUF202 family)
MATPAKGDFQQHGTPMGRALINDPGLQPQRTTLAWTRTGIGCAGLTGLLVRHAILTQRVLDVVAAALAAGAAVTVLALGRRRRDAIAKRLADGRTPVTPYGVIAVTLLVSMVAIVLLSSILMERLPS